jgi:RNA polymerase sigma-70 factor, ECF subfamily
VTGEPGGDFDDFYVATRSRLLHALYAMTGDLAEAQDVVQEAYARAWQRWSSITTYDDPVAWVRTVAWRLAVSRRRKAINRIGAALRLHALPAPVTEPSTDTAVVVAALRTLPEAQRRALALHYLCDLSVDAVAAETGVSTGTVKSRLSRGRTALAAILLETGDPRSGDQRDAGDPHALCDPNETREPRRVHTEETISG